MLNISQVLPALSQWNCLLFNCTIFNNCRDHNCKLYIPNKSWWVSFTWFLLPLILTWTLLPSTHPPPPPACFAYELTFVDPPFLSCLGAAFASIPALEMFLFNCHPQISRDTPGAHIFLIFC